MDQLDIAGYSYIDRLYKDSTYVPERRRFPNRIFLGTETTHALHNWLGVRDNDYVIGDFIWTGIDYLGETGALPYRGSQSGLIDIAGGKKPGFYQRAAYWQEAPALQIFALTGEAAPNAWRPQPAKLSWNFTKDSLYTVRAATNCDEVELFLNNHSLGRKAISHNTYFDDWKVAYQPGELKAVGYLKGKQVNTSTLVTAGAAATLQIKPLPVLFAGDVLFFEITVTDKKGLPVMDAKMPVTVKVQGDGELMGVDNGQLNFAGPYKTNTREAYNGRLLVTVKRIGQEKGMTVTAETAGVAMGILKRD